jgi:hypothetical protein
LPFFSCKWLALAEAIGCGGMVLMNNLPFCLVENVIWNGIGSKFVWHGIGREIFPLSLTSLEMLSQAKVDFIK